MKNGKDKRHKIMLFDIPIAWTVLVIDLSTRAIIELVIHWKIKIKSY